MIAFSRIALIAIFAGTLAVGPVANAQEAQGDEGSEFSLHEQNRHEELEYSSNGYRGISSFFNVREAYSNVSQGEWELEFSFEWETESEGDDEFEMAQSIKYGLTDQFHIELEIEQPSLGDGGESGAGETFLTLFYNCTGEKDWLPAIGSYVKARFPSGDGSAGVDVTFGTSLTKSLTDALRFHLHGYVMSANGHIGEQEEDERRDFQWGVGVGLDYQISEETLVGLNYLNRANHEDEYPNQNLLELALVQGIGEFWGAEHEIKLAVDFGLDGHESTPNAAAKIQWAIEW